MHVIKKAVCWLVLGMALTLVACATPAEKLQKFMARGNAYYEKGEYVKALLEYRNAIKVDPEYGEAYYSAGKVQLRQGKPQDAFAFFAKAAQKQPDHVGANLELGKFYLANRELDKAREKAGVVLGKDPGNLDALLLQGAILLAENKAGQARELLAGLLPRGAGEVDLYMLLSAAHRQLNEGAQAKAVLQQGCANNPKAIALHLALANLYAEAGQMAEVEKELRQVSAMEPDKAEHSFRLAAFYWQTKRHPEADALLQTLLEKDKAKEERWTEVANFYLARQQVEQAQKLLLAGVAQHPKSFGLRFLLRDVYVAQRNIDKAIAVLKECLTLGEDNASYVVAQRGLAELSYRLGSIEDAEQYVAAALKKSPKDLDSHLLNGAILQLKGELEQAIAEYRVVLQGRPGSIPVALRLADAYVRNRQYTLARETLQQALKTEADQPQVLRALARLAAQQKDYAEAEAQLRRLVDKHPDELAAKAELADFFLGHDGQEKGIALYQGIVEKDPANALGYLKLGMGYAQAKQWDKAKATMAAGLNRIPDSEVLLESYVRLAIERQQPDEALAAIAERLRRHPDDLLSHVLTGAVAMTRKDYPAAERAYRKAMAIDANMPEAAASLARVLVLEGQGEKAVAATEQLLASPPRTIGSYLLLGGLHEEMRQPQKAIPVYERAVTDHPENWVIANNLAYLLSEQSSSSDELTKALELSKKAQLLAPGNPAVLDTLGWLYFKMQKPAQARAVLALALLGSPNNPVFHYHFGMVLAKLGKKEEARESLGLAVNSQQAFGGREEAERTLRELI